MISLLEGNFAAVGAGERADHVGRRAAIAWELGSEGLREAGFLLPPAVYVELSERARQVRQGESQGSEFLDQLRAAFRFDDFFLAFVRSLEAWEADETGPPGAAEDSEKNALGPGDTLGGYEILGRVGEGAMGCVYRARQPSLDRLVAIKVLHAHHGHDPLNVERFREEAKAVAKLRHPNVVQIMEARSESKSGPHYIVLEFVDGTSLEELLEGGRQSEAEALRITLDVARALECAEKHGYVHRDVKPANILITKEGVAKLSDLGLARHTNQETRKTTAGLILGTPHYMAPEQALDEDAIDIRADLYSLGVSLFQMVTGALPFSGRSAIAVITQHANMEVPDPNGFVPDVEVSRDVGRLIRWMAARELDKRYPTMAEAIASLEVVLEGGEAVRPSSVPDHGPTRTLSRMPRSTFYSREGLLAAGPGGPGPKPDSPDPGGERTLDEDWAKLARTQIISATAAAPDRPDPEPTETEAGQLFLSDDTQRAYRIKRRLGMGTQGVVYEVEVLGGREFPGFRRPIEHAVMKRATDADAIDQERLIYSQIDFRMVKLLDHGLSTSGRPYLVLERLRGTPFERYQGEAKTQVRTDPATAVELFVNLLERLKGLHFRRKLPLVLCDIKPANIMIRMPTKAGTLGEEEYLERLISGVYEPVFVDLGCAQHRDVLREAKGRLRGLIGSPIFLPPESIPRFGHGSDDFIPGLYGPATDVYALSLTFYQWISGCRPYQHIESEWRTAPDPLSALFKLKRAKRDPIDEQALRPILGGNAQVVIDVIRAGCDPDPAKRSSTNRLFEMCKQLFELTHQTRPKGPYAFDSPYNRVSYRQGLFSPISAANNLYRRARRVEPE